MESNACAAARNSALSSAGQLDSRSRRICLIAGNITVTLQHCFIGCPSTEWHRGDPWHPWRTIASVMELSLITRIACGISTQLSEPDSSIGLRRCAVLPEGLGCQFARSAPISGFGALFGRFAALRLQLHNRSGPNRRRPKQIRYRE